MKTLLYLCTVPVLFLIWQGAVLGQTAAADPRELFEQGQAALQKRDLKTAEQLFKQVIAIDPHPASAYANLGVVYMREKQWTKALEALQSAQRLLPDVPGIRLNIGLVYYRQNKYEKAIPEFEAVVRDEPGSIQPRYLLGLCNFFIQRYEDAVAALQPIEAQESNDLNFLYVLAISAWESKQPQIEKRAMTRLVEIGADSPELRLLIGKAHLNRQEYDEAISELRIAAQASPRLPFVHFNLGLAYVKKQQFDQARSEFLKDAEIEPDVAYNYDQLGLIELDAQHPEIAREYFLKARRLDPTLASSRYGLARAYQAQGQYLKALPEIDLALQLQKKNSSFHYLRGQILQHLGRMNEAKAEMVEVTRISNEARNARQQELENPVPSPELQQSEP